MLGGVGDMNKDFHYGIVFIVARIAGLDPREARTVAHACQYVDDSTVSGVLHFAEGQTYERFASAHSMLDYRNFRNRADKLVWAPFHFVPGGDGGNFEERTTCRADSRIARRMMQRAIDDRAGANALHRLGVALHAYVDTWAHQGFIGVRSDLNVVHELERFDHRPRSLFTMLANSWAIVKDVVKQSVVNIVLRLGHGAALHHPDLPWLHWRYVNGKGQRISRENLDQFVDAADAAHKAIVAFRTGSPDFTVAPGLPTDAKKALRELMASNRGEDEDERLGEIAAHLATGRIPGLAESLPIYVAKGIGSWKHNATGIATAGSDLALRPEWSAAFEDSDYRKFHDALKEHRFHMMHVLLPSAGLRIA